MATRDETLESKAANWPAWDASSHPARLAEELEDGAVRCHLSPRKCRMSPGRPGFCRVRMNLNGRLVTLNYGRATHITQESIETEAVFHYAPGAPILSLGNIGCMLNCDYCHNWKTSQARMVASEDVHVYTPEQIVAIASERQIPVLSWTYNDPVVWHEFVLDTGRLARDRGLKNLYKSAFYISLEGAAELCEVIDIFSISVKSMDPDFYRRLTKGTLQPVLDATKFVFDKGKHLEISMLMVTEANDSRDDARRLASWVLTNLSSKVPVHFVRFHPDYKYTHVTRTPIDRLEAARKAALEEGLEYCYLGNVFDSESVHTYCAGCGGRLIERYGLNARQVGLDGDGRCRTCSRPLDFVALEYAAEESSDKIAPLETLMAEGRAQRQEFLWHGDIKALHVEAHNGGDTQASLCHRRLNGSSGPSAPRDVVVKAHDSFRFILSKSHPDESGIEIFSPRAFNLRLFEVYDRAHYPTVDLATGQAEQDTVPLPYYSGKPLRPSRA